MFPFHSVIYPLRSATIRIVPVTDSFGAEPIPMPFGLADETVDHQKPRRHSSGPMMVGGVAGRRPICFRQSRSWNLSKNAIGHSLDFRISTERSSIRSLDPRSPADRPLRPQIGRLRAHRVQRGCGRADYVAAPRTYPHRIALDHQWASPTRSPQSDAL